MILPPTDLLYTVLASQVKNLKSLHYPISTTLFLLLSPLTILILFLLTPNSSLKNSTSALLALPSTGGALSFILRMLSASVPTISFLLARGITRIFICLDIRISTTPSPFYSASSLRLCHVLPDASNAPHNPCCLCKYLPSF